MKYSDKLATGQESPDILPAKHAFKNGAFVIAGKTVSFLASFVVVSVLARYVPRDVAGSYNYIISTLTIISLATLPGMNNALVRAVAQGHAGSVIPLLKKRLTWGMIGSVVCLGVGIVSWLQGHSTLGIAFFIAAPFVPLTDTFSNFAFSFWQGKKRFGWSALSHTAYYVGLAALSIPVLILSDNLVIIVTGVMIAQTIMGFTVFNAIKKSAVGSFDSRSARLGMHLTVMQSMRIIASNVDRIIVWNFIGPAATAIYTFAATPVLKAWQMIPIGTVSLPHLAQHEFTQTVKKQILHKTFLLFLITIPAAAIIIIVAPFIYTIFFPLYPESVKYFQILIVPIALSPAMLLKIALTAFHKTKSLYISEVITPIIKIVLMIILVIPFGLTGIAGAVVIGSCLDFTILFILFLKTRTIPGK